ncbi:TonB family protein [Pasteurella atlantica]|uniref:TonB family protein n=2 Tax=Pasteurellaceae TaxID=712 RepID=A0ACC6HNQ0_9PAST|nr:TonB family protein [Pasteurella atlantica]MDP8052453.1 TonB family protein [Pasteurella atlantica]MDP8105732.1 TonB family protein [Pasteurella atlantica]MDP8149164.1 TonB family protein [Pasteurella atlantica]
MKNNSRIGLISSLLIHSGVFAAIFVAIENAAPVNYVEEQVTSISMEMMTARLEQQQVAVRTEVTPPPEPEKVIEDVIEPKKVVVPVPDKKVKPLEKKEKKKEKKKEEPKEKPKKKPKKKQHKKKKHKKKKHQSIKAKEVGKVARKGVVEKAKFNQGKQDQAGKNDGAKNGHSVQSGKVSSGIVNAYKARLQRALQRQAMRSYPTREKRMYKQGTVIIGFTVNSSGNVVDVKVVKSSGNRNFDNAAVKAAKRTKMNSAPPGGVLHITSVPIRFSLQQ